jgi:hypothetical protein
MQHPDLFSPIPCHTWDQGPLYLSIQHHGLFSSIPYMRPVTIISVYTTSWSLLTNPIHENRDHSICLCNTMVSSHQSHTWETSDHSICLYNIMVSSQDRVAPVLMYGIGEKRPWCCIDR